MKTTIPRYTIYHGVDPDDPNVLMVIQFLRSKYKKNKDPYAGSFRVLPAQLVVQRELVFHQQNMWVAPITCVR